MKRNSLEMLFSKKTTENGDLSFNTTGNVLLDILFMSEYYSKNLLATPQIGDSEYEKLFAMFIRDPRHGLGRRDLGRVLMRMSEVSIESMVKAGRYDDLLLFFKEPNVSSGLKKEVANYLLLEARKGNGLAKKWMPRLGGKDKVVAKEICKILGLKEKEYRAIIKNEDTVEYKLSYHETMQDTVFEGTASEKVVTAVSHPLKDTIDYEHVPSLAMIKYFDKFKRDDTVRFEEYLKKVEKGEAKLNVSTTNVYDIYKNRDKIDADLFIDKIPKIKINAIPILDTSGSMHDVNDSFGKALSIAHYIAKNSTYAKDYVVSFSSKPQLMKINPNGKVEETEETYWWRRGGVVDTSDGSTYSKELDSLYTGDVSNTNFASVMDLLQDLSDLPEFLVVLSDMEFDHGSQQSKTELQDLWEEKGYETKIVWWNFNSRSKTVPETDEMGNIYLSGYSPQLLKFLEAGFDGQTFLNTLLEEYHKKIK